MTYDRFSDIVRAEFPDLTEEQMDRFRAMEALYLDWNSRINVISRKDMDGFYEHHVLHSLAIASYWRRERILPSAHGLSVLDVGTGGGFPGIPLAVLFPQMDFTLCDIFTLADQACDVINLIAHIFVIGCVFRREKSVVSSCAVKGCLIDTAACRVQSCGSDILFCFECSSE